MRPSRRLLVGICCVAAFVAGGCAKPLPPPAAPAPPPEPAGPLAPLARVCHDTLPLPALASARTLGAVVRLLHRINPGLQVTVRPCKPGTSWPVGYATGDEEPKAPIGFVVLRMEGDALLTLDRKNRDTPTINLCADLELPIDADHRVRAIGLWESGDETAFDPARPEASTAQLAWLELFSRTPSRCAHGFVEEEAGAGEDWLLARIRCATAPLVLAKLPGCDEGRAFGPAPHPPEPAEAPDVKAVMAAARRLHRHEGEGRDRISQWLELIHEGPERCFHEPPPAARDVCLAVYSDGGGARWYGRAEVTRTGVGGDKNYVDSYLTFQVLKRIEAERKAASRPAPPPLPAK